MSYCSHISKHLRGIRDRGRQHYVKTDGSLSTDERKKAEEKDQMTCHLGRKAWVVPVLPVVRIPSRERRLLETMQLAIGEFITDSPRV